MIDKITPIRITKLGKVWGEYGYCAMARYNRLLHWIKAVVQGHLKLGSVLLNLSSNLDLYVNGEHLQIPEVLRDLKNLSMDTLRKLTHNFSDIGETILWEKFDWDDGFDPNEEYVIPAMAMGIIGKYIKVVFPGEMSTEKYSSYKKIAFLLDEFRGVKYATYTMKGEEMWFSVLVTEGEEYKLKRGSEEVIEIPFECIKIGDLLSGFKREEGKTYILMGTQEDIPVPYTLENIEGIVQPAISG